MNVWDWCIVMVGEDRLAVKHGAHVLKWLLVHEDVALLLLMRIMLLLWVLDVPALEVDLLWVS